MWVRGLKQSKMMWTMKFVVSHPMWVRGLKLLMFDFGSLIARRTPCGCVD